MFKEKQKALEIIAKKEGNSVEVQKIYRRILRIKAKTWFGTLVGGYVVKKYYELTGKI